jgi:hypothetical protein
MEPEIGRTYRVVIEQEFENPWIGKQGGGRIGSVDVAVPGARRGEAYELKVVSVAINPWTKRPQARVEILSGRPESSDRARFQSPPTSAFDLLDPSTLERLGQGFHRVGDHYLNIKKRPRSRIVQTEAWTWSAGGGIDRRKPHQEDRSFVLGLTHAGTPHRIRGMLGYWHISSRDELVVVLSDSRDVDATVCLLERKPLPGDREAVAWFCLQCSRLLKRYDYDSAQTGPDDDGPLFDSLQLHDWIREFNGSARVRVCPECGAEHPPAYDFNPAFDDPGALADSHW